MRDAPWRIRLAASFLAASAMSLGAAVAPAADNLTNALTAFNGDSTQTATQTALAAAGLNFTSTAGASEDPPGTQVDPSILFDNTGAIFGSQIVADGGRNFIRTTQADYANVSFVAEVTWETFDTSSQAGYFGLGSGDYGSFRIADWGTPNSAAQLFLEVSSTEPEVFTLKNDNTTADFDEGTAAPGLTGGTNRLRMTYDWFQKTATFAVDVNYAGGAFVADITTPSVKTVDLYGPDGWPTEPSRIYFGGDDGTTFRDLKITVSTPSMVLGDFNSDGNVTAADWTILRTNQLANLSGKTFQEAYLLGDVTADLANNHADFVAFKQIFDQANGVGAFAAMVGAVPEPSSAALLMMAGLLARPFVRRVGRRAGK